jgi:asparagine synthase (glutamine-hydrolysing)
MCRIAGIVDLSNTYDLKPSIIAMRDSMHRGGPDDAGVLIDEENRLAFGHRRLSLLDLSAAGHQPMNDNNSSNTIIFNGEIYNFLDIKSELSAKGYQFKTATDTEVILAAYHAYGTACFASFNGMFALAIWDKTAKKIVLARDHAGIKPLYYHISNNQLVFASEIRAFKALKQNWQEDENWRIPFLTFGHLPEPFTTLKNVHPLQKGSFLEIDLSTLNNRLTTFNKFEFTRQITNLEEAVGLVRNKLDQAVKRHLISDAPIGLFLSGGVDSSLLTLIANKYIGDNLKTLSIVFEDASLNEAPYQQLIIDKTNARHHSFLVTEKEFEEELPDILEAMDQPSTDGINSYFICKYARKYGLTAVLSGLGADELFGGYPSFNRTSTLNLIQKFPASIIGLSELVPKEKVRKLAFAKRKDLLGHYLFNRGSYTPQQVSKLLGVSSSNIHEVLNQVRFCNLPAGTDVRDKVSWIETNLYMQNQLLKDTDYMSMWHSLEVRVPFLDKELMEAAFSIAPKIKYDSKVGKHLLIKAFDDILPKAIWQRKKQGFTFPFHKWMRNIEMKSNDKQYDNVRKQYVNNKLHWSRYWGYLLSKDISKITYNQKKNQRVLFLNLTTFSTTGGIQKFNRAFLKALTELEEAGISASSMSLHDKGSDENYFSSDRYLPFKGKVFSFIAHVIRAASNYDTIVVGHINLALPAIAVKKLYPSKKLILIAHGIEVWDNLKGAKKQLLKQADQIIAVSNFTKQKLTKVQGIAPGKIKILHNTVDPYFKTPTYFDKPEYLKKRYGIHNGEKVMYTITRMSSLEQYKGYDKVLEILPKLKTTYPDIKYIIAGKADEIEKARVQKIVQENKLEDNVVLAGFIADDEVTDHFKLADVFVMPSSKEGFGIVFLEAMACGVPVIGGNIDGTVDALQNGKLGVLVNPSVAEEIQQGIKLQLEKKYKSEDSVKLQNDMLASFSFKIYKQRLKEILVVRNYE